MGVTERRARMKKFVFGFSPVRPPFFLLEPPPPPPKPQIGRKSEKQASAPPATSSSLIFQRFGSEKKWLKIAFFSGLSCRKIEHQAHALTMLFQNGFPPCAQLTPPLLPFREKISRKKTSPLIMFACLDTKSFTHRKWRDFCLDLKSKLIK